MQITWQSPVADELYVADRAWESAVLCACPFHPAGGCGVAKLGTYKRVVPVGARVARWWCPVARHSVSLLPTFLAARLSGTLDEVETVVAAVEQAGSVAQALDVVHPPDTEDAVSFESARRSLYRRLRAVRAALLAVVTLLPELLVGVAPTVLGLRAALGTCRVLVTLRALAERHLGSLPTPIGLGSRVSA